VRILSYPLCPTRPRADVLGVRGCADAGVVGSGGVAYLRTVKTASGARAVQIVYGSRCGARRIEHLGSAHDEPELEALKAAGRQRLAGRQGELDLGLAAVMGVGAVAACGCPKPRTLPLTWRFTDDDGAA